MKTKHILILTLLLLSLSLAREAQAFYNPSTGRWLSRDPIEEKGGKSLYGFVGNNSVIHIDTLGLAFYAIDGTWMDMLNLANPWQLFSETTERPRRYWAGPRNGATGSDLTQIAMRVYFQIQSDFCAAKAEGKDLTINMTGWSRGAMVAALVAQTMNDAGFVCNECAGLTRYRPIRVNWIGLFDAVAMTHDVGFPKKVPPNVAHFDHAVKTTLTQPYFPTWHFSGSNEEPFNNWDGTASEHADIGMSVILGNRNNAYPWLKLRASLVGVGF